jgi:agmatinase
MDEEQTFFGIATAERPTVALVGVPMELSSGCRPGGGNGPAAVREASRVLESYSPALDRDLKEVAIADAGDLELADDVEGAVDDIERAVAEVAGLRQLPVLVGGEHTISTGAVRALHRLHPHLVLLHVDAHTDLRTEYEGEGLSRATWIRYTGLELAQVAQVGVRSSGAEVARGPLQHLASFSEQLAVPDGSVRERPVYLSIDIDVLDPSAAPGVLCPEPGGASFAELLAFVHDLRELQVVGADVVEIAPDVDSSGITALAAAKLLRELILLFG